MHCSKCTSGVTAPFWNLQPVYTFWIKSGANITYAAEDCAYIPLLVLQSVAIWFWQTWMITAALEIESWLVRRQWFHIFHWGQCNTEWRPARKPVEDHLKQSRLLWRFKMKALLLHIGILKAKGFCSVDKVETSSFILL